MGLAVISDVTTVDGNVTTFVRTYSDDTTYTRTDTVNADGSTTSVATFRDGQVEEVTNYTGSGGSAGFIDPNTGSPEEELSTGKIGRQTWRDLLD